jgi:MFS family permease
MKKQISALFLSNLAILFIGFGLFPLLPVYASRFGATPSTIGIYLALTYIAISLGTMLPGWLSGRISQKLVFVTAGFLGAPAVMLLGQATAFWQVVVLTSLVWFTGGVGIALVSLFTGRLANQEQRGRWFSLIALTTPLGAVMGGSLVAWLVETQGYQVMFTALGPIYALWPIVGFLLVKEPRAVQTAQTTSRKSGNALAVHPDRRFSLLLMSALLGAMTISISRLGLSLSMKAALFPAAEIARTNVVGGLVTIPFVIGSGLLSDRLGRRLFLVTGYLLAALSSLLLISASQLWHFWIVSASVLLARSITASLASALATDILSPKALGEALPRLTSLYWVAGVLGFAGSGYVMERLGQNSLYWIATFFALAAAALTSLMTRGREKPVSELNPPQVQPLSPSAKGSGAD